MASERRVTIFPSARFPLLFEIHGTCLWDFLRLTSLPESSIAEMREGRSLSETACSVPVLSCVELAAAFSRLAGNSHFEVGFSTQTAHAKFEAMCEDQMVKAQISVYARLSSLGWRLRHGGRFGAHFLGYRPCGVMGSDSHNHAEVLVCVTPRFSFKTEENETRKMLALHRVARSVGKRLFVVSDCDCAACTVQGCTCNSAIA